MVANILGPSAIGRIRCYILGQATFYEREIAVTDPSAINIPRATFRSLKGGRFRCVQTKALLKAPQLHRYALEYFNKHRPALLMEPRSRSKRLSVALSYGTETFR